ncbi:MAG: hypothetical protein H0X51_09775 [Parachlamydiaceae bacterium]|nr:hypothetical protein [Parachlamydiaceae bacterium]
MSDGVFITLRRETLLDVMVVALKEGPKRDNIHFFIISSKLGLGGLVVTGVATLVVVASLSFSFISFVSRGGVNLVFAAVAVLLVTATAVGSMGGCVGAAAGAAGEEEGRGDKDKPGMSPGERGLSGGKFIVFSSVIEVIKTTYYYYVIITRKSIIGTNKL